MSIQQLFAPLRESLAGRYGQREALIQHSRDLTSQSKKMIFAFHRISGDISHEGIAASGKSTEEIRGVLCSSWAAMAESLIRLDAQFKGHGESHLFRKQVGGAVEEYVEALCTGHYLFHNDYLDFDRLLQITRWILLSGRKDGSRDEQLVEAGEATKSTDQQGEGSNQDNNNKNDNEDEEQPSKRRKTNKARKQRDAQQPGVANGRYLAIALDHVILRGGDAQRLQKEQLAIVSQHQSEWSQTTVPYVSRIDHIMGLLDSTGEMMRYTFKRLLGERSDDAVDVSWGTVKIAADLRKLLLSLELVLERHPETSNHSLAFKVKVLRDNLRKVENNIYEVCVSGRGDTNLEFAG